MMVRWSSYLYKYPSKIDILAYYTDRFTDVTPDAIDITAATARTVATPIFLVPL
jgi:hypothetical protein